MCCSGKRGYMKKSIIWKSAVILLMVGALAGCVNSECYDAAKKIVDEKNVSRSELISELKKRTFESDDIDKVISRMERRGEADWNKEALDEAKEILSASDSTGYSSESLKQTLSESGYSDSEISAAIEQMSSDGSLNWNDEAVKAADTIAEKYDSLSDLKSHDVAVPLIRNDLITEKSFTEEQADYGVSNMTHVFYGDADEAFRNQLQDMYNKVNDAMTTMRQNYRWLKNLNPYSESYLDDSLAYLNQADAASAEAESIISQLDSMDESTMTAANAKYYEAMKSNIKALVE